MSVALSAISASAAKSAEAPPLQVEEVIVTAERREASLQDTPIAVTSISGAQFNAGPPVDMRSLQYLAPSLQVGEWFGKTMVTLRGIGNDQVGISADPGVAVHVDGVYMAQRAYLSGALYDIQRAEVLRGPQGTLYGRNATGGVTNFITRDPTVEPQGYAGVTVGNYDLVSVQGAFGGALVGETLLGRVAFKTKKHDGYTPNLFNGQRYDDADESSVRAKLKWLAGERLTVDLQADYHKAGGFGSILVVDRFVPESGPGAGVPIPTFSETQGGLVPYGRRAVNHNDELHSFTKAKGVSAKVTWDLGPATLTSLTSYRKLRSYLSYDTDDSQLPLAKFDPADERTHQTTQEFDLASNGNGPLRWILGAFYWREQGDASLLIGQAPVLGGNLPLQAKIGSSSYAVFGEATFEVSDRLKVTGGLRYNRDEKKIAECFVPLFCSSDREGWDSLTPRGTITFQPNDDLTLYATVSRGFKAGGFNIFGFQAPYDPEKVTNYEAGLKSQLFDRRLQANFAVFRMDYSGLQVFQVANLLPVVTNAASATIDGVESDFKARLTPNFSIDGNATYLKAQYDDYDFPDPTLGNAVVDVSGRTLTATPKWALNLGAEFELPLEGWGRAILRGEYSYKSRMYFRPTNDRSTSQGGYDLFNARLTLVPDAGHWTFIAWGQNLTDEDVYGKRQLGAGAYGFPVLSQFLPPRTYGVTAQFEF
ncbi:MAG: TonB-dependent receptor [Alphaproteobacteria bacterium]|nr:TonB-dependent receptor [Alphaproteobacteria bacterium]